MKKALLILSVLGLVVSVEAQGIVLFNNNNGTKINTNSVVGGAATGVASVGNFYYALFASTTTSVLGSTAAVLGASTSYAFDDSNWTFQALGTNTATAGRFASTTADASGNTALTFAGGNNVYFTVIGWSANIGDTLSSLETYLQNPGSLGYVGESIVSGAIIPGVLGSTPAGALFGTGSPYLGAFTLGEVSPTPEPGTMALACFGGIAGLLAFRRKK